MKVGLIGCAHMHAESYLRCFKELNIPVVGIYEKNLKEKNKFSDRHQLAAYDSLADLLATDCDTVLICSENKFHLEYALLASEAKKHVIVEKPMALSQIEAKEMIKSCQKNHVKLLVCHPVRYSKVMQELKQAIESDQLGNLIAINATNHGKIPGGWFVNKDLAGGGAIVDHTIHVADLVNWLFNLKIESVMAYGNTAVSEIPTEDSGLLNVTFTSGALMSLDTSWNRPKEYPVWGDASLEIITDKGRTVVDGFGRKAEFFSNQLGENSWLYYETDMNMGMIKEFVNVIEKDLPSPVDGQAGLFTIQMFELAYQSIINQKKAYL